jgi:hypothetical protein
VQFPTEITATDAPKLAGQLSEVDATEASWTGRELWAVGSTAALRRWVQMGCRKEPSGIVASSLFIVFQ